MVTNGNWTPGEYYIVNTAAICNDVHLKPI